MALPNLPGYTRLSPAELAARGLSPKSRAVLTPSGAVIPRRQYENLRIQSQPERYGWRSWSQFQLARKSPIYQYDFDLALKAHPDVKPKDMRRIDSEFNHLYASAMPYWNKRKSPEYRDPNGPVASFLVYLGLRDEDATYDVGMTNIQQ